MYCLYMQLAYDECKKFVMEELMQSLKRVVEMNPEESRVDHTNEKEDLADIQKAYGYLLSACKMNEMLPLEQVITIHIHTLRLFV